MLLMFVLPCLAVAAGLIAVLFHSGSVGTIAAARREIVAAIARHRPSLLRYVPGPTTLPSARLAGPVGLRRDSCTSKLGEETPFVRTMVVPGPARGVAIGPDGLVESHEWHKSKQPNSGIDRTGRVVSERAICINSLAHYTEMGVTIPEAPATGESVLVTEEFNVDTVCVGDVVEVETSTTPVVLTVTHPRRPCHRFANKYGSRDHFFGFMHRGLAGIFCSVKTSGTLDIANARVTVVARPHPQWTLRRCNALIYGATQWNKEPFWRGTPSELDELIALPELGSWQWKEYLQTLKQS